jgi:hypothetical protein
MDRCVSEELVVVETGSVLLRWEANVSAGFRNVDFILLHRGMVGMMTMVGDTPGEVRGPEEGVGDEAYDVADPFMGGECSVAGFMAYHPDTGEDETLEPPTMIVN